jgi:hypothetical protein
MPSSVRILTGGDPSNAENWLECIPWTGYGRQFPVGVILPPGIKDIRDLIKEVLVLDGESDEGYKRMKKSEVNSNMSIINIQLNENALAMILGPTGADSEAIVIVDPTNGKQYTRLGWWKNHEHTDGLAMIAYSRLIRGMRREAAGR